MSVEVLEPFTCANCQRTDVGDPELVMRLDIRWDLDEALENPGARLPLCRACALVRIRVLDEEELPVDPRYRAADFFSRAYP
jgi:hypothetical protein